MARNEAVVCLLDMSKSMLEPFAEWEDGALSRFEAGETSLAISGRTCKSHVVHPSDRPQRVIPSSP
jgi:hypothetical protein